MVLHEAMRLVEGDALSLTGKPLWPVVGAPKEGCRVIWMIEGHYLEGIR